MYRLIVNITIWPLFIFAAEWQSLNGPPVGRADDISIGYYEGEWVIYAADQTHKLYKSRNEGEYWDSLTYLDITENPTCVITRANNAQVVYIGRNGDVPVWWSQDGGQTWDERSGEDPNNVTNSNPLCFVMDPNGADVIYLGCAAGPCAIYKTTDGGERWNEKEIITAETDPTANDLAIAADPVRGTTILAACDDGIYRSTSGGNSWVSTQGGVVHTVEFVSSFLDDYAYAGGQNGVYKTTNGGVDWAPLSASPGNVRTIAIIDANTVYAGTNHVSGAQCHGVYKTTDGGITWNDCNGVGEDKIFCKLVQKILVHPSDNDKLFVGTEKAIYKTLNGGEDWLEITEGFKLLKAQAIDVSGMYQYALGGSQTLEDVQLYVFRSTDAGNTWKCVDDTCPYWHNGAPAPYTVSVSSSDPAFALLGYTHHFRATESGLGGSICKTSDGGLNWTLVYFTPNTAEQDPVYSVLINPLNNQYTYAGYCNAHQQKGFMRSSNFGDPPWQARIHGLGSEDSVYSITVNPQNWDMLYAGTASDGVYKTRDNADHWNQTGLTDVDINALAIDIDYPDILYAGSDEPHGVYKTTDGGATWDSINNGLGDYLYIKDLALDPEEPTIVYALCQEAANTDESFVYCTVDRGGQWFDVSNGLPTDSMTYDLAMDYRVADPVYAATGKGVYAYTPDFNKSLVSSSDAATSYNNGKKLLRITGTDEFWVCYESGGMIYAVHSTDEGQTWSKKMEIGRGYNPVISERPATGASPKPGIVWWAKGDRDTLYFARYVSADAWTAPYVLVTSDSDLGPPALVIDPDAMGHLVYAEMDAIRYTQFDIDDPCSSEPEAVGDGNSPSIGFMGSTGNPLLHVVWEHEVTVLYRSRTAAGAWSGVDTVFTNALHPALEVAGNCVYVVWETSGDILWRYAYYREGEYFWTRYQRLCMTANPSTYPVLSGGYACAWVEELGHNMEIHFSFHDPEIGWTEPINISSTDANSAYPHLVHKQIMSQTTYYFIWTEGNAAPLDIKFQSYSEPEKGLAFYMAQGGNEEPSPFNLRREGYIEYGTEPYKQIDFDASFLEYRFEGLDSAQTYALEAYVYQQGQTNLALTFKIENIQVGGIVLPSDTLLVLKHTIPSNWYCDGIIGIKIFGNNAVSAILVIYEYEPELGGGPQSATASPYGSDLLMLDVIPNPMYKAINISYALTSDAVVNLSLFDVTGRSVKELVNMPQHAGDHQEVFLLPDLPQGVYFIRLNTGCEQKTAKVILLK